MEVSGGNVAYTAVNVPCHIRQVRRWWKTYQTTEDVVDASRSGRPRLLSDGAADVALDLLLHEDTSGASQVAQQLAVQGLTSKVVNRSTIIRAARMAATRRGELLVNKRGKPTKGMTAKTKAKRLAFARAYKGHPWDLTVFTDRKRFYFRYPGSKVKASRWQLEGKCDDNAVNQPTNPQCVNVYAGISPWGMTAMHVVAGTSKHKTQHTTMQGKPARNITRAEYQEVMQKTLLPDACKLFASNFKAPGKGKLKWWFQQDNDPCHGAAAPIIQQWNHSKGADVQLLLNWPPNSPDLNIIENVWAWVQQQVNKRGCKDFGEFKAAVEQGIAAVPKEMISNLYNSMKTRLDLVIENEGGPTGY